MNCSSLTGNSNSCTHKVDTKECIAPYSNNTDKHLPATKHSPRMRLPNLDASSLDKEKTLPTACGLSPPLLVSCWWDGCCVICLPGALWTPPSRQFLAMCPNLLQLKHFIYVVFLGQSFFKCGPLHWKHLTLPYEDGWDWGKDAIELEDWGLTYGFCCCALFLPPEDPLWCNLMTLLGWCSSLSIIFAFSLNAGNSQIHISTTIFFKSCLSHSSNFLHPKPQRWLGC